ncbi:BTAD domain-containing putative transcriptional regulator [Nonomuraea sp. CA-218870]|uniref:BTAD domain-containing putative transcriptional regulator n=1 Tax=Nonomuraea sp. CA-218870 TaxID=3239998 RepID=UPI003D92BD14
MTLREFLLAYRRQTGITQRELAARAGISVRLLRDLEHGVALRPNSRSKASLAQAVGLSVAELDLLQPNTPAAARHPLLRVDVLGPLTIRVRGNAVDLAPPSQRRLLGLLTLRAGHVVTHTEIVDFLWDADIPASYLNLVHGHLSRLRRFLGDADTGAQLITRTGAGYRLNLAADQSDALEFTGLLERAAAHRAAGSADAARQAYEQALSLWRGQPLADLPAHTFQHPTVVALARQRLTAVLEYADLALDAGHAGPALERLHEVAHTEPLHEGLNARILLALAASGQRAAAIRRYDDLRDRLRTELGIDPGPELRDARARALHRDDPRDDPRDDVRDDVRVSHRGPATAPPPDAARAAVPAQLPPDLAAFTGRLEQLGMLDAYLSAADAHPAAARVSVISGTAGVGKTSLAVHWAHRVRRRFPDGQLYYNLRGYSAHTAKTAADALTGFLLALGVAPASVPLDVEARSALFRSLTAERRLLVVLDDVISPEEVRPVLPANSGSAVVVTSRNDLSGLRVHDDALIVELDVLSTREAVTLLTRTLAPRADDTPAHLFEQLAELCARLPLALRIAAANISRGTYATVRDYVTALREGDRLAELAVDGAPGAAVEAAFALSYAALPPSTARLFRLLGLLPGIDFGVEAAAALTGSPVREIRRELARLATANLVDRVEPGRYRFHDLLRLYAAERATTLESPRRLTEARQRLYDWYLLSVRAAVERSHPHWGRLPLASGPEGVRAMEFADLAAAARWLAREHGNLVAAVHAAARSGPRRSAWLLVDAMRSHFWASGNMTDWLSCARAAATAAEEEGEAAGQAAALLSLADAHAFHRRREALSLYEQAFELAVKGDWRAGASSIVNNLGGHQARFGKLPDAVGTLRRGIELDEEDGRTAWLGVKHVNLAATYAQLGLLEDAHSHLLKAVDLHPDLDGIIALNLGEVCHLRGSFAEALRHLGQARARSLSAKARSVELSCLVVLAEVRGELGDHDTALALAQEALDRSRDLHDRYTQAQAHNALGRLQQLTGRPARAAEHHERAADLAGDPHPIVRAFALVGRAVAAGDLRDPGADAFAGQALRIARERSFRIVEGQARTALAGIALAAGDLAQAEREARAALDVHRATGHRLGEARAARVLGDVLTGADGAAYRRESARLRRELGVTHRSTL